MNYIGSKKHLLDFIQNSIKKQVGSINDKVFCDLFAGTGVVGGHFKNSVKKVIANDIEPYAYAIIYNKIKNSSTYNLNNIKYKPKEGFIYKNYALERSYFSKENAKKIDGLREAIQKSFTCKDITKDQYYYCLASLLFSADRVANTTGVYGSFLKNMKFMAKTQLKLLAHEFELSDNEHEVYNEDANELIKKIEGDILYLDPPYNHRQYGLNYHILNTIVKNTEFEPRGKSGFDDYIRSDYCKKNRVEIALDELIKEAKFKYIFLSYSDDGILDKMSIEKIMRKYGSYSLEKCNHSRYRTNKKSTKGCVVEYLHVVRKNAL
jgi:adenine-specific DNA-methyltransferase